MCIGGSSGPSYPAPLPKPAAIPGVVPVPNEMDPFSSETPATPTPAEPPKTVSGDTGLYIPE